MPHRQPQTGLKTCCSKPGKAARAEVIARRISSAFSPDCVLLVAPLALLTLRVILGECGSGTGLLIETGADVAAGSCTRAMIGVNR